MIKKHLVLCTVLFFLTFAGSILISYLTAKPITEANTPVEAAVASPVERIPATFAADESLSFAEEKIPKGDARVVYRMNKALRAYRYKRTRTTMLHDKASRWFPVIEPILKQYGIPEDFKYITLVESGLKEGTSVKGASGYWQFMPGTARSYGLKVNSAVDERQNMRKSTVAACKYIRELFTDLKSWTLVAAAYNIGDTKLKSQIMRQKQANYFKMKLNRETAGYVYKIISMKEIIEKPVKYGYANGKGTLLARTASKPVNYSYNLAPSSAGHGLQLWKN